MRPAFRRETVIALRARRQAHQIASSIEHPELNVPRPAEQHAPASWDDEWSDPPSDAADGGERQQSPVDLPQWLRERHKCIEERDEPWARRVAIALIVALFVF